LRKASIAAGYEHHQRRPTKSACSLVTREDQDGHQEDTPQNQEGL
jgi:hypothetical protein